MVLSALRRAGQRHTCSDSLWNMTSRSVVVVAITLSISASMREPGIPGQDHTLMPR